jgi:hypothetical protein
LADKELKKTIVTYAQYTDYEFIDPSTFYIVDAMQNYVYYHTSKREVAQQAVDNEYGKGRYTVKASKLQKTKSRLENGGVSCHGTASRARPSSCAPK